MLIKVLPGVCKGKPEVVEGSIVVSGLMLEAGLRGLAVGGLMLVVVKGLTVGWRGSIDCSQLYNFFTS